MNDLMNDLLMNDLMNDLLMNNLMNGLFLNDLSSNSIEISELSPNRTTAVFYPNKKFLMVFELLFRTRIDINIAENKSLNNFFLKFLYIKF
jgi:hypothetical protein